ncbi:phage portal protein [Erythrobacter sp. R86502]|uniref:phage portal protein n=1 Tax=Erythrobacter sp. R86502 TaxID=3093846 RepID=UPI0036D439A9
MARSWYNFFAPVEQTSAPDTSEQKSSSRLAILEEIAGAQASNTQEVVNWDTATKVSAVFACARVIAEDLAKVPCGLYRKMPDGSRDQVINHPLHALLSHAPNDWQTSFEFREQIGLHLALTGNAFVFVTRNSRGQPLEMYAFEPSSVTVTRHSDYTFTYKVHSTGARGAKRDIVVPTENMWHIRGPSWNGIEGYDPVHLAREAIGLGLATEKFGANLFKNGARPGGILSTEAQLTPDQVDKLRSTWNSQQAGNANAHKTALLPNGLKWQSISNSANEAQWTESRRYQIEEICRFFRVNPVMVMQNANATSYASIEQLFLSHVANTMMPWFQRFEQAAFVALLTPQEKADGYYIKLNEKALMRASAAERAAFYREGITQGWLTRNEVRGWEDLCKSADPTADKLTPAANLFGQQNTPPADEDDQ